MIKTLFTLTLIVLSIPLPAQWTIDMLSQARDKIGVVQAGDQLFFAGGFSLTPFGGSKVIDIYDLNTQTWTQDTLSVPRNSMVATTVGDHIYFAGGSGAPSEDKILDIYNTSTEEWTVLNVPNAVGTKAMASLDQEVFIGAGKHIDIYNTEDGTWASHLLAVPRGLMCAVSVGSKVLFAGGSFDSKNSAVVDIYDANSQSWSQATLSEARSDIGCVSDGTKAYFAGGSNGINSYSKMIDIYDSVNDSWSTDTLNMPKRGVSAAYSNGFVYFGGGTIGNFNSYTTEIEILNTTTGQKSYENLSEKKTNISSIGVDGKIFFAGGSTSSGRTALVEIFDALVNSNETPIDHQVKQLEVYPNPAVDMLILNVDPTSLAELIIYDQQGSIRLSKVNSDIPSTILDISSLNNSTYWIKTVSKSGIISMGKFIVAK